MSLGFVVGESRTESAIFSLLPQAILKCVVSRDFILKVNKKSKVVTVIHGTSELAISIALLHIRSFPCHFPLPLKENFMQYTNRSHQDCFVWSIG